MSTIQTKAEKTIGLGWEGAGCPVLVRGTTAEYRRSLAEIARGDDIAVEIGSAAGVTTVKLARLCHRTVGVDAQGSEVVISTAYAQKGGFRTTLEDGEIMSTSAGAAGNSSQPEGNDDTSTCAQIVPPLDPSKKPVVQFVVAKIKTGRDCRESLKPLEDVLAQRGHTLRDVSLLAIDIAGTASLEVISPIIVSLKEVMRPRITVVKSLSLRKLYISLVAGEDLLAEEEENDCKQEGGTYMNTCRSTREAK